MKNSLVYKIQILLCAKWKFPNVQKKKELRLNKQNQKKTSDFDFEPCKRNNNLDWKACRKERIVLYERKSTYIENNTPLRNGDQAPQCAVFYKTKKNQIGRHGAVQQSATIPTRWTYIPITCEFYLQWCIF